MEQVCNRRAVLKAELSVLESQRDLLEIEATAIREDLLSPGLNGEPPAGIDTPLVDDEDFPRADIELFSVRQKRQRLAILNTGVLIQNNIFILLSCNN